MDNKPGNTDVKALLSSALTKLKAMQTRLEEVEYAQTEPIAIIGMGCRFPGGASTPARFWELLQRGGDGTQEIPPERWDVAVYYDPDPDAPDKMYTKRGGFLAEIDQFDPQFFGISPREATTLDPQQRLLLEVSWEALENAGQDPERLRQSKTGVFVGIGGSDYGHLLVDSGRQHEIDAYTGTGGGLSFAAGRLSYVLGLQGPALAIDTTCSSSLVAVHLACQSLRQSECSLALVGGVHLILSPDVFVYLSKVKALAPDGRCKAFDAAADGFVRGEGCGVIVLKRLAEAEANGDNILAVIRGSAINHDGASSGLTVPNGLAQQQVIREALQQAKVEAQAVSFVEAHGTGTALGDPIEIGALAATYGRSRQTGQPLFVGAVKTNVGHLEAAAGIAGLIKTVLALKHQHIPPNLHFDTLNPHISLDNTAITLPNEGVVWAAPAGLPRLAGVSSFGLSGTNAHVILSEAPVSPSRSTPPDRPFDILTLSAKSEPALVALVDQYHQYLATKPELTLNQLCAGVNPSRAKFSHRLALVSHSLPHLEQSLGTFDVTQRSSSLVVGNTTHTMPPRVAFLFTGQGSQYVNMGGELYESEPLFRQTLEQCDQLLQPYLERSLLSVIYPADPSQPVWLDQTAYTQPALFALEYALAQLWRAWGVEPVAVMGHSVGEVVAACLAGVISLDEGLLLIVRRAQLMQALPTGGAMATVFAAEDQVTQALAPYKGSLAVAVINGPQNIVISGDGEAMKEVLDRFAGQEIEARPLNVSHAFHSPLMEPMLDDFEQSLRSINFKPPRLALISNMTGQKVAAHETLDASYWRRHVRQPVQFLSSIHTLVQQQIDTLIEIGPSPTLIGMAQRFLPAGRVVGLPSLRPRRSDWQQMLESLAELYVRGTKIKWDGVHREGKVHLESLPTYPFQRQRFWLDEALSHGRVATTRTHNPGEGYHPLLGRRLRTPKSKEIIYEASLSLEQQPFLRDHRVFDLAIFPAAAFLEMVLAAVKIHFGSDQYALTDLTINEALKFIEGEARVVQVILTLKNPHEASFQIVSLPAQAYAGQQDTPWTMHLAGSVRDNQLGPDTIAANTKHQAAYRAARNQSRAAISPQTYYTALRNRGLQFGSSFQGIKRLWSLHQDAIAEVSLPQRVVAEAEAYGIHPVLLDAGLQTLGAVLLDDLPQTNAGEVFLPIAIDQFRLYRRGQTRLWSHARLRSQLEPDQDTLVGDIYLFDDDDQIVATITGLQVIRVKAAAFLTPTDQGWNDWLYEVQWQEKSYPAHQANHPLLTYRPDLNRISEYIHTALPNLISQFDLDRYQEVSPQLNRLSVDYVVQALAQLGWQFTLHQQFSADLLIEQVGIARQHHRLVGRMLEMLHQIGYLQPHDAGWKVIQLPTVGDIPAKRTAFLDQFSNLHTELALLVRCGEALAPALKGEIDPVKLLFPDGSVNDLEQIYQTSPFSRFYNTLAQETIVQALDCLPVGRPLRILEIGGGTGGTTSLILPILPPDRTEYVFSDISNLFTTKAANKFEDFPFVRYQLLDIEKDPLRQGFDPQSFDIIIAANVLHATADLKVTMGHVRQLLAPTGMLVMLENVMAQNWIDLTFGLTEGWWKFTDLELRPSYVLITPEQWQTLLVETGFQRPHVIPMTNGDDILAQQALIVAQNVEAELETGLLALIDCNPEQPWLIFADQAGLGQALADDLGKHGCLSHLIYPGPQYGQNDAGAFTINPAHPDHFERLLNHTIGAAGTAAGGLVYLWPLDTPPTADLSPEQLDEIQITVCGGVLHLVQALLNQDEGRSLPPVWLVTQGAQPVADETADQLAVAQGPLWGLGKVIALEHPELRCTRIDVDPTTDQNQHLTLLIETLLNEGEDQIAFRGGQRYAARLVKRELTGAGQTGDLSKLKTPLAAEATYLIVGGLGGLGLAVARWLVENGARCLMLMGRSQPSPSARMHLNELEALGARVVLAQGDVSCEADVTQVLNDIKRDLPPLRGVIHSAGVLDDGVISQQRWERFTTVMAPKMRGGWLLHQQTQELPLDFYILFSSAASLAGSFSQANHSAANAFLDGLAHYRRAQGLPAISINWGPWSEVGAAAEEKVAERIATQGLGTITPNQGLQILTQAIRHNPIQIGAMAVNWNQLAQQNPVYQQSRFFTTLLATDETQTHQGLDRSEQPDFFDQLRDASAEQRLDYLIADLKQRIAHVFRFASIDSIDAHQSLNDFGLDSLMALELKNRINLDYGVSIPVSHFIEGPSPAQLAGLLSQRLLEMNNETPLPAAKRGVEEPSNKSPLKHGEAEHLLSQLDHLSDEQVDALLNDLLINGGEGLP